MELQGRLELTGLLMPGRAGGGSGLLLVLNWRSVEKRLPAIICEDHPGGEIRCRSAGTA